MRVRRRPRVLAASWVILLLLEWPTASVASLSFERIDCRGDRRAAIAEIAGFLRRRGGGATVTPLLTRSCSVLQLGYEVSIDMRIDVEKMYLESFGAGSALSAAMSSTRRWVDDLLAISAYDDHKQLKKHLPSVFPLSLASSRVA